MKSKRSIKEMLIGVLLLLVSYGMFPFIPHDESIWGYIICGISAFCFIVGFVWVGNFFSNPSSKIGATLTSIFLALLAIGMVAFGSYYMISDKFGFRGVIFFTLLLIEAVFMFMFSRGSVYNEAMDGMQMVDNLYTSLDVLYEDFKNVDTPYGRPWMGHVSSIEEDCMIYGPTLDGSFIFCHYSFGKFFIGESGYYAKLSEEDIEKHLVNTIIGNGHEDDEEAPVFNLIGRLYPRLYHDMFTEYARSGKAEWLYDSLVGENGAKIYTFDERFAWFHQVYHLIDENGNKIYDVRGTAPFKTFKLFESDSEREVIMMTKRLLRLLPRYDFYVNGNRYGTMRQRAKIWHDEFKMDTTDGQLKLRNVSVSFGTNYAAYMDDRLIGILSENLNLRIRNIIFDNFTITVLDSRYLPILTAMGIMAERELVRDRHGKV